jgi:flagellar hook-length control protein FliK
MLGFFTNQGLTKSRVARWVLSSNCCATRFDSGKPKLVSKLQKQAVSRPKRQTFTAFAPTTMHITAVSLDLPGNIPASTVGEGLPSEAHPDGFHMALLQASQQTSNSADPSLPLKAVALGSVELITAQAPAPEAGELKAFAAAQGLSPEAVAWLFGSPDPQQASADQTSDETTGQTIAVTDPEPEPEANPALLVTLPLVLAHWAPPSTTPTATPPTTPEPNVLPAGWQSTQMLLSAGGKATATQASPNSAEPAIPEEVMDLLDLDPEAQELLNKLGLLDKDAKEGKTGALSNAASSQPTLGTELRSPLEALHRPTLLAGQAAAAPTAAQAENATPADRAAQIQALAQKIGEALGQRLMGHIERGQWQVRLLLRPASLGEVEVDLRLRAGELDATLRAMNPLTRELLSEGLPRLREGLTQAGMEVAQLHVGTGDASRNGGNPTPRSFARKPEQSASGAAEGSSGITPVESSAIRRTGADGWDVMV